MREVACFAESTTCFSALLLVPRCASALLGLVQSFADLDAESVFEGSAHPGIAGRDCDVGMPVLYAATLPVSKADASGCCTFERSKCFTRAPESLR